MYKLAAGLVERRVPTDLVLVKRIGPYLQQLPGAVRVVDLNSRRMIESIPALVRYLRNERPACLISALSHANVVAILSHMIARSPAKLIVSERTPPLQAKMNAKLFRDRLLPFLIRLLYKHANRVVAVSYDVADQLGIIGVPRKKISVVYNPVVNDALLQMAIEAVDHPWFAPGAPAIIVAAGRLAIEKDFQTLIRAFSLVRNSRPLRLMILGEGEDRAELCNLAEQLGVADDVSLPGFVDNPYKYMRCAMVFILSSLFEGFPNVVVEAMACGAPIISTNCPSAAEILENGRWGRLIPVGDVGALAKTIQEVLDEASHPDVKSRARIFSVDKMTDQYLKIIAA